MYILVDTRSGIARLEAPEDTRRFHVQLQGAADGLAHVLAPFGQLDGDHAWIDPSAIRRAAEGRTAPEWEQQFEAMLTFARSKGWTDAAGRIRAHVQQG